MINLIHIFGVEAQRGRLFVCICEVKIKLMVKIEEVFDIIPALACFRKKSIERKQ